MIDPADNLTQSLPVTAPLCLRIDTPDKLVQAELLQDLAGCWILIQSSIAKNGGRSTRRTTVVENHETGLLLMDKLVKRYRSAATADA